MIALTTNFLGYEIALSIGGFIGGRLVSYRVLFTVGISLQIIAALFLTSATTNTVYLAAFLLIKLSLYQLHVTTII